MPGESVGRSAVFALAMVAFALYFLASAVHLYFVYKENEAGRRLTKIVPLLLLSVSSLFLLSEGRLGLLPAVVGFLLSILGDFLFLYKKKKPFLIVGTAAFFLAHAAFLFAIGAFFPETASFFPYGLIYLPAAAVLAFYPVYRFVRGSLVFSLLGSAYFAFVTALAFFFVLRFFDPGTPFSLAETAVGLAGGVLFAISDMINAYTLFRKDVKRRDFYIMLPYILAQAALYLSFCLLPVLGV